MKSAEQIARAAFDELPTADKMLVLDWVELGNSWEDSMISSGVCSGPRDATPFRMTPRQAEQQQQLDEFHEKALARREKYLLPDEVSRRYETSHHESAHCVVAMALGGAVLVASINPEDATNGRCRYRKAGTTDLEVAIISVAPVVWIEKVYYKEFRYHLPWGATGCEDDLQIAREAVGSDMNFELGKAFRHAKEILNENYDQTVALAEKLDRDGEWRPVRTTPRRSYFPVPLPWGGA